MRVQRLIAGAVAVVIAAGMAAAAQMAVATRPAVAKSATVLAASNRSAEPLAALDTASAARLLWRPPTRSAVAGAGVPHQMGKAAPAPPAAPAGLPAPTAHLPTVAPAGPQREVDAVVTLPGSITPAEVNALLHTAGLSAIEEVDTGTVTLAGSPAATFGVDPGTFRQFTPLVTDRETRLWQYVSAGALASSYEMATDRRLPLGTRLPIIPAGAGRPATSGWLGAFASIGIPGVDMVVSHAYSHALGLVPDSGLVVSAAGMNPFLLQQALGHDLPGANIELTHPELVTAPASGSFVSAQTMAKVISAAISRVGAPYVWGGDGPNAFDCSGLVGWAFAQAGIAMPRTAAQQYLTGPQVALSALQAGDLLFWAYDPADPGFVDHVAMYVGNGLMVVAPHTGTDVQIAQVPTADLVGAVRVDPAMSARVGGARFP